MMDNDLMRFQPLLLRTKLAKFRKSLGSQTTKKEQTTRQWQSARGQFVFRRIGAAVEPGHVRSRGRKGILPMRAVLDDSDPATDPRAFRRCLAQFATGVNVVTTQVGHERVGITANSFASLSLDPPLVLWSIGKTSRSFASFERCSHFAVNILAADQIEVSRIFSGPETNKFAHLAWSPGVTTSPVIDGALGIIECSKEASYEGGDHLLFVGRVKRFARYEGTPLIFAQGRYAVADDHPDGLVLQAAIDSLTPAEDDSFSRLVFETHHALSSKFEDHRKIQHVTTSEQRVLACARRYPGLNIEELATRMILGPRDAADTVAQLILRGFIVKQASGALNITPDGELCRAALSARLFEFEAAQLSGLPTDELATCRRLLRKLAGRPA